MSPTPAHHEFLGTYFDRDRLLRIERWARYIAWAILFSYLIQSAYDIVLNSYNSILNGYSLDWYFFFMTLTRPLQGAMMFALLHLAGQGLLVLMDIEENTRRAARHQGGQQKE